MRVCVCVYIHIYVYAPFSVCAGCDAHGLVGGEVALVFVWDAVDAQRADGGQEATQRVLGVDASLDGPAVARHLWVPK